MLFPALFAAAQGNVGRGNMSVMESFKTVWNDISRGGDDAVQLSFVNTKTWRCWNAGTNKRNRNTS